MLIAQSVSTKKHISGHLRQGQVMKQKQDFSDAQSASILGENTTKKSGIPLNPLR